MALGNDNDTIFVSSNVFYCSFFNNVSAKRPSSGYDTATKNTGIYIGLLASTVHNIGRWSRLMCARGAQNLKRITELE